MKRRKPAKSDVNRLIDALLHPLFPDPLAVIIDGILHALNEQNPAESAAKFAAYNLPILLQTLTTPAHPSKPKRRKKRKTIRKIRSYTWRSNHE